MNYESWLFGLDGTSIIDKQREANKLGISLRDLFDKLKIEKEFGRYEE